MRKRKHRNIEYDANFNNIQKMITRGESIKYCLKGKDKSKTNSNNFFTVYNNLQESEKYAPHRILQNAATSDVSLFAF